uniref:RNA-directed DNA polymerase n=1 Tax=Plectus sambesii TaxID=2011161 RepID=A0A914VEK8_9BILA
MLRTESQANAQMVDSAIIQKSETEGMTDAVQRLQTELRRVQRAHDQLARQVQLDQSQIALLREQLSDTVNAGSDDDDAWSVRSGVGKGAQMNDAPWGASPLPIAEARQRVSEGGLTTPFRAVTGPPATFGSGAAAQATDGVVAPGQHHPNTASTVPFYQFKAPSLAREPLQQPGSRQSAFCPNAIKLMSKLTKFTGNVAENRVMFADWLKDFYVRLDTLGVEVESIVALNVLRDNLGGAALQTFDLIPNHCRSFEYAVAYLTDKFDAMNSFNADYHLFVSMRQNQSESCDDFARKLQIRAQQVFRARDEQMVDELLRGQFISGLYDQDVQSKVKLERGLNTFVDVVAYTRHIEQHRREMQALHSDQSQPQQTQFNQNNNKQTGWNTGNSARQPTTSTFDQAPANQQQTANTSTTIPSPGQTMAPAPTTQTLQCWTCGETGHRSSNCPAKAKGEARPRQTQVTKNEPNSDRGQYRANAAQQNKPGEPPTTAADQHLSLFYDYVAHDPYIMTEYTSDVMNVRSMSAELKNDSTLFGPLTEVSFNVCGLTSSGPIDSGSQTSIVSYELLRKLRVGKHIDIREACTDCPPGMDIRSVTNQQLPILGLLTLSVTAPTGKTIRAPFLVQEYGLGHDILIGTNYMAQLGYSLVADGLGNALDKSPVAPMQRPLSVMHAQPARVRLVKPVSILSQRDQLLTVRTEHPLKNAEDEPILFEPDVERSFDGLQMQAMIVQPDSNGEFKLLVRNLSTQRLCLDPNEYLGTAETVEMTPLLQETNDERNPTVPIVQLLTKSDDSMNPDRASRLLESISWDGCALAPEARQQLKELIVEFEHAFALDDNELGQTHVATHKIDTGEAKPVKQPLRPCPFALRETVNRLTQQYLAQGIISPSKSPWSSPLVIVKKKDSTPRYCVDMRAVNTATKVDAYPLPRIKDILHSLNGRSRFTLIDLRSGFWQVPLDPESREKTAFNTYTGHYEFNVMPFGLVNSGATFERLMETVLAGLQWNFVFLYLDDILIASPDDKSHIQHIRMVLERLKQANLRAKPSKCAFGKSQTEYLGHIISAEGIKPDPAKTAMIANLATPRNLKKLQAFLGFATYYREFVPDLAKIAAPLYALTAKDVKFSWSKECEAAFRTICQALCTAPLLAYPDFEGAQSGERPFLLYTDACKSAIGAVISQSGRDGKIHVLAYESRKTRGAEQNYGITDLEALALVHTVKKFRQLLYGYPCVAYTDHAALKSLMTNKHVSGRLARWQLLLSEFHLTITVRPGSKHQNADFLSRLHEDEEGVELDAEAQKQRVGVGESLGTVLLTHTVDAGSSARDDVSVPMRPIISEQRVDVFFGPIIDYLESGSLPDDPKTAKRIVIEASQYAIDDSALFFVDHKRKGHMRLALPQELRQTAVIEVHAGVFGGHLCFERVYYALAHTYYWPGMAKDVKRWLRSCLVCATSRDSPKHRPPLNPIQTEGIFDVLSVDVLEMPLTCNGNRYIVSFVDCFSKYCEAFATANQTAETIARLLVNNVVCRHGCPAKLLSDRGPAFMSDLMSEVLQHLGIKKLNTSGYHPQGNGEVERMNRTLIKMLQRSADATVDWDRRLPFTLFAYNSTPAKSHGFPPSFLLYGREVRRPLSIDFEPPPSADAAQIDDYRHELLANLAAANEAAMARLEKAQNRQKQYYDKQQPISKFSVGQRVLVYMPVEKTGKTRKLNRPNYGPFYIRTLTESNAEIELATDSTDKRFVALERLRPCPLEIPSDQVYVGQRKKRRRRRKQPSINEPRKDQTNCQTMARQGEPSGNLDGAVELQRQPNDSMSAQNHHNLRPNPKRTTLPAGFRRW